MYVRRRRGFEGIGENDGFCGWGEYDFSGDEGVVVVVGRDGGVGGEDGGGGENGCEVGGEGGGVGLDCVEEGVLGGFGWVVVCG